MNGNRVMSKITGLSLKETITVSGKPVRPLDGRLSDGCQGQDAGQRWLRRRAEVHPSVPVDAAPGEPAGHQPADPGHPDRGLRGAEVPPETEVKG